MLNKSKAARWTSAIVFGIVAMASLPARAGNYLYWTDLGNGTISRYNLTLQTGPEVIVTGLTEPRYIATDGNNLYWTDDIDGAIYTAPMDGTTTTGVVSTFLSASTTNALTTVPQGIAWDGSHLYWSEPDNHTIGRTDLAQSAFLDNWITSTQLGSVYPYCLATDGNNVYFSDQTNQVVSWYSTGNSPAAVSTVVPEGTNPNIIGVAVLGNSLFWTDGQDNASTPQPQIDYAVTANSFTSATETGYPFLGVGTFTGSTPNYDGYSEGLVVADNIYYTDVVNGTLWSSPTDASAPPTALVTGLNTPTGITFVSANLVITLDSFTASQSGNQVTLVWTTGSEFDNAGFNVLRSASPNGGFVKVNSQLIPSKAAFPAGASYTWTDPTATAGQNWFYELQDVATNNAATLHGPISGHSGASGIQSFQAVPATIFQGGVATLSWTANGATGLTLSGTGSVSGTSLQVKPTSSQSFTLSDASGDLDLTTVTVRRFTAEDMPGLSKAWGSKVGDAAYDPAYDLNGDGKVDDTDVALLLNH